MGSTVRFHALDLSSRFQPIYGVAERRAIGYEALLTARHGQRHAVAPAALFEIASGAGEAVYLDWLARALHLRNFATLDAAAGARLFLNVSPRTAIEDLRFPSVFASVMESFEVDPARIVIEILEDGAEDEARLADAVAYYRAFGCAIALDDYASSACCEERLARLRPDVVKVDRGFVAPAGIDANAQRRLSETVAMIHAFGASVVLEGIETVDEAQAALESGAECVQGFFFASPSEQPSEGAAAARFARLTRRRPPSRRAPRPAPWPVRACGRAC